MKARQDEQCLSIQLCSTDVRDECSRWFYNRMKRKKIFVQNISFVSHWSKSNKRQWISLFTSLTLCPFPLLTSSLPLFCIFVLPDGQPFDLDIINFLSSPCPIRLSSLVSLFHYERWWNSIDILLLSFSIRFSESIQLNYIRLCSSW